MEPLGKHSEQNKIMRYGVLKALGVVKRALVCCYHQNIWKRIGFVNNLTIKHCDKTKIKTITVKNSRCCEKSSSFEFGVIIKILHGISRDVNAL